MTRKLVGQLTAVFRTMYVTTKEHDSALQTGNTSRQRVGLPTQHWKILCVFIQHLFRVSGEPNTPGQEWIQFDLGRVVVVYGIVTRGRSDYAQWVTSYMVHYASELNPLAPALTTWTPVTDMLDIDTVVSSG